MARKRNPKREEAFELFKKHNGNIANRAIANKLDVPEKTISAWKCRDKWNEKLGVKTKRSTATNRSTSNNKRQEQRERITNALVEAGIYSPALDLLIDVYLDAYEDYVTAKASGGETEKLRKELAKLLGQLGLDGKNKDLIKQNGRLLEKQQEEAKEEEVPQNNKLLMFRQRMSK